MNTGITLRALRHYRKFCLNLRRDFPEMTTNCGLDEEAKRALRAIKSLTKKKGEPTT